MATKISNAMPKIQTTKNIVLFPIALSLKNVIASLSNEKNNNNTRRSLTNQIN
jgi:hypothetical protein